MDRERNGMVEGRRHQRGCFILIIAALAALSAVVFVWGISTSQYDIGFLEAYRVLMDCITGVPLDGTYDSWMKDYVVVELNIPRLVGGLAIGIVLAVSGAIMQSVIKNPLADPYTTGISSGALLGVSIYIAMGISLVPGLSGDSAQMMNAFLFSLIPTAAIVAITVMKRNITPTMMILVGIGVMYLFSAVSSMVRYQADPDAAHEIFTWTLGTLGHVSWDNMWILVAVSALILAFGIAVSKTLNALTAGDNLARCLGVNVRVFRTACLVAVAAATGIVVSFSGTIGFVGLICPHIARILVGSNNRYVIPCSALVGAVMLMFTDSVAKIIVTSGLPVGAITALIGSPIFVYLLIRQKKNIW